MSNEEQVYKIATWLAKKDGVEEDDLHRLIWEGSPPEPWGEVWNRYEDDARELLSMLAAPSPSDSGSGEDERAAKKHERVQFLEWFEKELYEPNIGIVENGLKRASAWAGWKAHAALKD